MAENEARRRRQFQARVCTALATGTILIVGMLVQGCRTQQLAATGTPTQDQTVRVIHTTPSQKVNPFPVPMATSTTVDETNWISPLPSSPPQYVTPAPAPAPVAQTIAPPTPPPLPEPPTPAIAPSHAGEIYVVKSGDSLSRIAHAHGTTVKALKTANHLKSDRIKVGQKLKLPPAK